MLPDSHRTNRPRITQRLNAPRNSPHRTHLRIFPRLTAVWARLEGDAARVVMSLRPEAHVLSEQYLRQSGVQQRCRSARIALLRAVRLTGRGARACVLYVQGF